MVEIKFSGTLKQVHDEIKSFARALDKKEEHVEVTGTSGKRYQVSIPPEETADIDIPVTRKSDALPLGGVIPKTNGPQSKGGRDCQFCGLFFMRAGKHEPHCSDNPNKRPFLKASKPNDRLPPPMDEDMENMPF